MFKNGQSVNWQMDYKRFVGMSYADVVRCKSTVNNTLGGFSKQEGNSQVKDVTSSRTHTPITQRVVLPHSKSMAKQSDVHSNLTRVRSDKGVNRKSASYADDVEIQSHNKFEVLNSINDIDLSEISNVSNIESHHAVYSQNSSRAKKHVNTAKRSNETNKTEVDGNVWCMDDHDKAVTATKNCRQSRIKNTGKKFTKEVFLKKEYEDKYDLELRFKPKYRQRVSEAKHIGTFKNWDNQMEDKYGFVPLGDIHVPDRNNKNPSIGNIKFLHETVKNSKNFNFMDSQIQVESQLNPEVWDSYLKQYWDKQLCYLIRYGFPLDHKEDSPLDHHFKNHNTATQYEADVKAYLKEEIQFGAIMGPY